MTADTHLLLLMCQATYESESFKDISLLNSYNNPTK